MAKKAATQASGASAVELEGLMQEILRTFHDLRTAGPRIGLVTDWGKGSWGLLQTLAAEGPMTMSDLARKRAVSRQYIQKIACAPIREEWIRLEPNPADRRAPLMAITPAGQRRIRAHRKRIDRALRTLSRNLVAEDVTRAAATVALMRTLLDAVQSSAEPPEGG